MGSEGRTSSRSRLEVYDSVPTSPCLRGRFFPRLSSLSCPDATSPAASDDTVKLSGTLSGFLFNTGELSSSFCFCSDFFLFPKVDFVTGVTFTGLASVLGTFKDVNSAGSLLLRTFCDPLTLLNGLFPELGSGLQGLASSSKVRSVSPPSLSMSINCGIYTRMNNHRSPSCS